MFGLCLELGIDDPVHWFRHTEPKVIDAWIAYRIVESEEENEGPKGNTDPATVFQQRFAHLANKV